LLTCLPQVTLSFWQSFSLSIYKSNCPTVCPSVRQSVCPLAPIHRSFFLSVHMSICLSLCPYAYMCVLLHVNMYVGLFGHLSFCPSVCFEFQIKLNSALLSFCPSVHLSICFEFQIELYSVLLSICLSIRFEFQIELYSVLLSFCPSVHLSIHPFRISN
jgi:hypothetical protein